MSAKDAIQSNLSDLNKAIARDGGGNFKGILQRCVEAKFITPTEKNNLTDTFKGQSLQTRVDSFVSSMLGLVTGLPDSLDEFLYILYQTGDPWIQAVAKKVASKFGGGLPKYEAAVSSESSTQEAAAASVPRGEGGGRERGQCYLDTTQLDDILTALNEAHFAARGWSRFGLSLGLYQPTLDNIQEDWPRDASKCLSQTLTKWLERADGVNGKGGPTQTALVKALEKQNKAAADYIRKYNFIKSQPIQEEVHVPQEEVPQPMAPQVITQDERGGGGGEIRQRRVAGQEALSTVTPTKPPKGNKCNRLWWCAIPAGIVVLLLLYSYRAELSNIIINIIGNNNILDNGNNNVPTNDNNQVPVNGGAGKHAASGTNSKDEILKLEQLSLVINTLSDSNFPSSSWQKLGLELGLHPNTLKSIQADKNTVEDRMQEMIDNWLHRTANGVDKKGGPTWTTLANALENIKYRSSADYIREKMGQST